MQNEIDILEKKFGVNLWDYQKSIIEKAIKSKTPIYINVVPSSGRTVFLSLLTKIINDDTKGV